MKLLERESFIKDLKAHLSEAASGRGSLVFVAGEAGIGKTVLLRVFGQSVEGIARVAAGACDPLSTPRPLGPMLDVGGLAPGAIALLDAAAPRGEVFQTFLRETGEAPTLVVFEDAQWADEATLDLLQFLGRRIQRTRALLVVTYRDDEIDGRHPLTTVLGDLATTAGVRRMALPRLSESAVRTMALGSDHDPAELYRLTGGNPFFVTEVLASGAPGIPVTVRDAVLARAGRLSPAGRRVLETAAVIGARLEPRLVAAVAGTDADALDECVATGMLRRQESMLVFRHELARGALLEAIPPLRQVALHRAVLAALRSSPAVEADVARLAHHAEAAGEREAVLEYAQAAAVRAAALGAHREAAAQYARALRFAEGLAPAVRADLLERRAYQLFLTAEFKEAITTHEGSLECRRAAGGAPAIGASLRALSRILWCVGRIHDAERTAREAIGLLEQLPWGPELAMAYSGMSSICLNAEDAASTHDWAARAFRLAETCNVVEATVQTLNNVGTMDLLRGVPGGREQLERSLDLARQAGLEEHVGRAFIHFGWTAARTRRFDMMDRVAEGLEFAGERDLYLWRLWLNAYRSRMDLDRGQWTEALAPAAFVAGARGASLSRVPALCVQALVAGRRGAGGAWPLLDEALALAEPTHQLQHIAPVAAARAELAWLEGDVATIDPATREAFALALRARDPWTLGELAYWRWRAGLLADPPPEAVAPYARMIEGNWPSAERLWSEIGCPYETAFALADSGDEEALRRGLAIADRLGARPLAAMVSRKLREMGVRGIPRGPRPTTRAHPAGLTSRELELVPLLVQGLSNAEIAQRSYLAVKTVDNHVSSILSKLGARRRVDVAREAVRLGLVPDAAGTAKAE